MAKIPDSLAANPEFPCGEMVLSVHLRDTLYENNKAHSLEAMGFILYGNKITRQ